MVCDWQSQAFPKISQKSLSSQGLFPHVSLWLPGFSFFFFFLASNQIQNSAFIGWLKNSTSESHGHLGTLYLNFERMPRMAIVWFVSPPSPSILLLLSRFPAPILCNLPASLLRSNKHIPLPAPCSDLFISRSLKASAYIPSTCQGSFLNKYLVLH